MKVNNMFNDTMKQTTKNPTALAMLAGAFTHPMLFPIGIGAIGVTALVVAIKKNSAKETAQNGSEQAQSTFATVQNEPFEPYNKQYEPTAQEPSGTVEYEMTEEEYSKEVIRQAMSELGKKSGEARRRKRDMLAKQ